MSEQFDTELAHAVKQSAAKSLEGWEFTPAMQRSVLERIERAAAGTVPAASPSRRFEPGRFIRPLAWTAVAAAALVVVVNTRVSERGPVAKNAPAGSATQSAQASPAATGGSDSVAKELLPAPAPSGDGAAGTGSTGPRAAQPPAAPAAQPPAAPVAQPPAAPAQPPAVAAVPTRTAESTEPAATKLPDASTPPADSAERKPSSAGPDNVAIAGAPADTGENPQQPAPSAYHGGAVALLVPPAAAKGKQSLSKGLMAVTSDKLRVQAVRDRVVELSQSAVRSLTPDGEEAWAYPLVGATEESLLAVAEDGSVAVALANKLHVLTPEGKLLRTLEPAGTVTALAWGAGGRLAIAAGSVVTVVRPATVAAEFHTEAISRPELSFGPDGMLAVFGDGKSGRELLLYDKGGAVTARVHLGRSTARGLAFTGGVVVAGSQAYGPLGGPLWQAPFAPQGMTALTGSELLVVRKADIVVALRAGDGVPVWQAAWSGAGQGLERVVAAPDGRYLAVLGSTDEGWVLWVLDQLGKVLYAERLPEAPSDMAFVGDRLMLLTPQGAAFRSIQH